MDIIWITGTAVLYEQVPYSLRNKKGSMILSGVSGMIIEEDDGWVESLGCPWYGKA